MPRWPGRPTVNTCFTWTSTPKPCWPYRVMRHKLGTDPSEDVLVYEETDNTFLQRGGAQPFGRLHHADASEYRYHRGAIAGRRMTHWGSFKPFLPRETGHEYEVDHANGRFFIRTNWQAENFRVMTVDLGNSADKSAWKEVVPHREDAMVSDIQAFDNWLVLGERQDGLRKVRVMAHDGSMDRYLDGSEEASVMWPSTNVSTDTDTIRYGYSSLVTPTIRYGKST